MSNSRDRGTGPPSATGETDPGTDRDVDEGIERDVDENAGRDHEAASAIQTSLAELQESSEEIADGTRRITEMTTTQYESM
jgi:methyl-accepting chemotaxis protein